MDTPTSPAPTNPTALKLDDCLSQLAAGTFAYGHLAAFSDLKREQVRRVELVWSDIDHEIRRKLTAAAADLSDENVEYQFGRLFRIAMRDPEPDVRQVALAGLWEDDSQSLLEDLLQMALEDPSDDVRAIAVTHLGYALPMVIDSGNDAEFCERISDLILAVAADDDESSIVRRQGVEAVGSLEQDDETREIIQDAWEHGDQALEAAALVAMGRSLESRWRVIVRLAVGSDDAELRYEATRALGSIGTPDDVPALAERTLDDDSDVRLAAIVSLGEIGGPGAVRVLRNLADQVDESVQELIEDALDAALLMGDPLRLPT